MHCGLFLLPSLPSQSASLPAFLGDLGEGDPGKAVIEAQTAQAALT